MLLPLFVNLQTCRSAELKLASWGSEKPLERNSITVHRSWRLREKGFTTNSRVWLVCVKIPKEISCFELQHHLQDSYHYCSEHGSTVHQLITGINHWTTKLLYQSVTGFYSQAPLIFLLHTWLLLKKAKYIIRKIWKQFTTSVCPPGFMCLKNRVFLFFYYIFFTIFFYVDSSVHWFSLLRGRQKILGI